MSAPVTLATPLVVPVKSFASAKARLAPALDAAERAGLARRLADGVVDAAGDRPVVVACDDDDVRRWARARGLRTAWTPGHDLSGSVAAAVGRLGAEGAVVVGVAHADLPFPATLSEVVDRGRPGTVVLVGDRDGDGTNVMVLPAGCGFRFAYGPGSLGRHVSEAERLGLVVDLVDDPALAWDLDTPADLSPPAGLGRPPWEWVDG